MKTRVSLFYLSTLMGAAVHAATIGAVAVTPNTAPAGVATAVTATATITDPTLIPSTVALQQLDSAGHVTTLGSLHDDGLNGDAVAGDKIFSLRVTIFQANPGSVSLRVSAGFQGSLLRT